MSYYLGIFIGLAATYWSGKQTLRMYRQARRKVYWRQARGHVESRRMVDRWKTYEREHGFK